MTQSIEWLLLLLKLWSHTRDKIIVDTDCGPVEGFYTNGSYSFRGIPYASPPVGKLRWHPPEIISSKAGNCWNGIFQAKSYGNTCFQKDIKSEKTFIGSEDCLYLNIITPDLRPLVLKPVMVWIHGGSLQVSNGNWPLYEPTEQLAKETDIVYVGFNYRLHAFGFMALQMLADISPTNASGNYGFMDMIAVLNWVQTNIRNFGGDPNKVTVFGQSSGGTAIFALLASPLCKGLFHRAWLLSASPILNKTATDAYRDNEAFLRNSNCTDVDCIYDLTSEEVTMAVPWYTYPNWAMADQGELPTKGHFDGAIAIVDGVVIPEAPFDAWANGHAIDVPILIGSLANDVEMSSFYTQVGNWTWLKYVDYLNQTIGTFGNLVLQTAIKMYPTHHITPRFQLSSMASDIRLNCPNDVMAMYASSTFTSPVYRYVVTSKPSVPIYPVGLPDPSSYSMHMWDVFAFFGFIPDYIQNPTIDDIQWQRNVQKEVLSFVRRGKPASLSWKPYPGVTANLSSVTTALSAYHPVQCAFWLKNGFFDYAWIN